MDSAGPDRPQRRTVRVGRELGRYGIQIAALSEIRVGRELGRYGIQIVALSEIPFADVGETKEVSSGVDAKMKRDVKQELALPLKRSLFVSFQDCQKISMAA